MSLTMQATTEQKHNSILVTLPHKQVKKMDALYNPIDHHDHHQQHANKLDR